MAATLWAYWAGNDGLWHGPEESIYASAIDACKVADQIFVQWPAQWGLRAICQVWVGNEVPGLAPSLVYQRNFDPSLDTLVQFDGVTATVGQTEGFGTWASQSIQGAFASAFTWDLAMALYAQNAFTPLEVTAFTGTPSRPIVGQSGALAANTSRTIAKFWKDLATPRFAAWPLYQGPPVM